MRITIIIFLFYTTKLFGQALTEAEAVKYVRSIDSLKNMHQLQESFYPNMSFCGGALYGYYSHDKLVFIDATYGAELGFASTKIYFNDTVIYKIIYRQCLPDWDKFMKKYPDANEKLIKKKMTYYDTTFTIIPIKPLIFTKATNKKIISKNVDSKIVDRLLYCGQDMRKELESEKIKP
jgi:hypothetical protein